MNAGTTGCAAKPCKQGVLQRCVGRGRAANGSGGGSRRRWQQRWQLVRGPAWGCLPADPCCTTIHTCGAAQLQQQAGLGAAMHRWRPWALAGALGITCCRCGCRATIAEGSSSARGSASSSSSCALPSKAWLSLRCVIKGCDHAHARPAGPPIAGEAHQLPAGQPPCRWLGGGAACGHPAIAASERAARPSSAPASALVAPTLTPLFVRPERWPDALPASVRDTEAARHHVSAGRPRQRQHIAQNWLAPGHPGPRQRAPPRPSLPTPCRLRQMKAKLSSASGSKAGTPPKPSAGGQQGARAPGGAAPSGPLTGPGANGPGPASGAAPADQRSSLPPLTPEEMRRQYAGACGDAAAAGRLPNGQPWSKYMHSRRPRGSAGGAPPLSHPPPRCPTCLHLQIRCRCCGTCRPTRSRRCLCASCTSVPSPSTSRVRCFPAALGAGRDASTRWALCLPPRCCPLALPCRSTSALDLLLLLQKKQPAAFCWHTVVAMPLCSSAGSPTIRCRHRRRCCRPSGACAGEGDQAADAAGDGGLRQLGQRQVHGAGAAVDAVLAQWQRVWLAPGGSAKCAEQGRHGGPYVAPVGQRLGLEVVGGGGAAHSAGAEGYSAAAGPARVLLLSSCPPHGLDAKLLTGDVQAAVRRWRPTSCSCSPPTCSARCTRSKHTTCVACRLAHACLPAGGGSGGGITGGAVQLPQHPSPHRGSWCMIGAQLTLLMGC